MIPPITYGPPAAYGDRLLQISRGPNLINPEVPRVSERNLASVRTNSWVSRLDSASTPAGDLALKFYQDNEGIGEPCGTNCNWITDWFWNGYRAAWLAWCAATVSRSLVAAGFTNDGETLNLRQYGFWQETDKGWGYVPAECYAFVKAERFTSDPSEAAPGSAIIFNYSGSWRDPKYGTPGDHTGLLAADLGDGTVMAWEGNDRNNSIGLWRRPMGEIYGFGVPPFELLTPKPMPARNIIPVIS